MNDDASATFRGFRHQALYALWRMLTDADAHEKSYRPEGGEDLAVLDSRFQLVEAIQVKDHSTPISLSKLKLGFWTRYLSRLDRWPNSRTKLATFGELGPELEGAISGKGEARRKVLAKLCSKDTGLKRADVERMLNGLNGNVVRPVATDLLRGVLDALRNTYVGGCVEHSAELLMYWVFEASEQQRTLTRADLILQLERIGGYLAALRDFSAEWGTNIVALSHCLIPDEEKARLTGEYRRGVQARWEHIVIGADCPRIDRLAEIHQKLSAFPIVIIRGASGQGKSTLGWRYMHDFTPDGVRFYVRRVDGREHAAKVADALGNHVRKLRLKGTVYVDVAPSDSGWAELISELAAAGLRVLVAVREEDFRRANVATADFHFGEVAIEKLSRDEAVEIFATLNGAGAGSFLDFDDAWARFGMTDGGPLMEFTHLVTQGELLESRIKSQIVRLQRDAANGTFGLSQQHIELLAHAAIANSTGARVFLSELCSTVGLSPISLPLRVLEEEYLLRLDTSDGATAVAPLHALRSKAVVDALFSEMPESWADYACRTLPLVLDSDIETLLLTAFSRHPQFSGKIVTGLGCLPVRSWTHASGIAAALLWLGLSRYEENNRDTITALLAKYDSAWWMMCDSCVGSKKNITEDLLETMQTFMKGHYEPVSLTPKTDVFEAFYAWAENASVSASPTTTSDWRGLGQIAHWIGHCGCEGKLWADVEACLPADFSGDLDLESIATFVCGRSQLGDERFSTWHGTATQSLKARFMEDTASEHLSDDSRDIVVYFGTPLADRLCRHDPKAHDWHWQAMKRVRLLRMLFPDRENYGSKGIGLVPLQLGHDPSEKFIPAKNLQHERTTRLNAQFHALVAYRHQRASSWKDYAGAVLNFRRTVCECFRKLHRAWGELLSENQPQSGAIKHLPGAEMEALKTISNLPMFPHSAVDEWGFISEGRSEDSAGDNRRLIELLHRFKAWKKSLSDFESGVGRVVSGIMPTTIVFAAEYKGYEATEADEKTNRLSVVNLGVAWESLASMQNEFRRQFGSFFSASDLDELDKHERSNFRHLWPVMFAMQYERGTRIPNFGRVKERKAEAIRQAYLRKLASEIESVLGRGLVQVAEEPWILDGEAHLQVTCNHSCFASLESNSPLIVEALWRASQFRSWRNFEWVPLVVEWPTVAVAHLFRGKAIAPACVLVDLKTLFVSEDKFTPQQHHLMAISAPRADFLATGILLWEHPLLEQLLALHGSILAFGTSVIRLCEYLALAEEKRIDLGDVERILPRFSKELNLVWHDALAAFDVAINTLGTGEFTQSSRWREMLEEACSKLLFKTNPTESLLLNIDDVLNWTNSSAENFGAFNRVIGDVLDGATE
jgi:hypothetical protein